jgi:hypothetical protein
MVSVAPLGTTVDAPLRVADGSVNPVGSVVLSDGTPPELVTKTALSTGVTKLVALAPVWYGISFAAPPAIFVALPALFAVHDVHVPVRLVMTPALGVPKAGVVSVRFVADKPLGKVVLSDGTPPELVIKTALFTGAMKLEAPAPVWYGISFAAPPVILLALFAVQDVQVPVKFVMTPALGVPSAGVVSVRFVADSPLGSVVLSDGTPLPFVLSTALLTGAMNPVVPAPD